MTDLTHFLTADRIVGSLLLLWLVGLVWFAARQCLGFWRDLEQAKVDQQAKHDPRIQASALTAPRAAGLHSHSKRVS